MADKGKQQRIRWTPQQKEQVLREAARIKNSNPKIAVIPLVSTAQLVLDKELQRPLQFFQRAPSNMWFYDNIDRAVQCHREGKPFYYRNPNEENVVEPNLGFVEQDHFLKEREETSKAGDSESALAAVELLVESFNARLDVVAKNIEITNQNIVNLFSLFQRGFFVSPAPLTPLVPDINQEVEEEDEEEENEPIVKTVYVNEKKRKPKVLVLDILSGHQQTNIRDSCRSYADVRFRNSEKEKFPKFEDIDYIIASSETPQEWFAKAQQQRFYQDRIQKVNGSIKGQLIPTVISVAKKL